jgi:hypothetical protein
MLAVLITKLDDEEEDEVVNGASLSVAVDDIPSTKGTIVARCLPSL